MKAITGGSRKWAGHRRLSDRLSMASDLARKWSVFKGTLYVPCVGYPQRAMHERYGKWNSVNCSSIVGRTGCLGRPAWKRLTEPGLTDDGQHMIDSSQATGAKGVS